MFTLVSPELIQLAMRISDCNQKDFSTMIGRSQAQISKYLSGKSEIPAEVSIRCMNIIRQVEPEKDSHIELLFRVSVLNDERHQPLRRALMEVIRAWEEK